VPAPTFLSSSEAARLVGVSRDTILRYKNEGLLPYIQPGPGRHHRFRRKDVLALFEVKTATASDNAPPAA
jgi:excisionase family DNA binding protein